MFLPSTIWGVYLVLFCLVASHVFVSHKLPLQNSFSRFAQLSIFLTSSHSFFFVTVSVMCLGHVTVFHGSLTYNVVKYMDLLDMLDNLWYWITELLQIILI